MLIVVETIPATWDLHHLHNFNSINMFDYVLYKK